MYRSAHLLKKESHHDEDLAKKFERGNEISSEMLLTWIERNKKLSTFYAGTMPVPPTS